MTAAFHPRAVDVRETEKRSASSLISLYSLAGFDNLKLGSPHRLEELTPRLSLGRFSRDDSIIVVEEALLEAECTVTADDGVVFEADTLCVSRVTLGTSDVVLMVEIDFDGSRLEAIRLLQETCFKKNEVLLNGKHLLDFVPKSTGFERELHQVVLPGGALLAELNRGAAGAAAGTYDRDAALTLVYREDAAVFTGASSAHNPKELNRIGGTYCVHGRGVTVLIGAAPHVEAGTILTAMELLAQRNRLHRIPAQAEEAIDASKPSETTPGAQRGGSFRISDELLDEQTAKLEPLLAGIQRIEAEFVGVHVGTLRLPELVLQNYHDTLGETLQIPSASSRALDALSRLEATLAQRQDEIVNLRSKFDRIARRRTRWAVGWLTLVAVPFTVVFGFFGMSTKDVTNHSIGFTPFLGAWLAILGLTLGGTVVVYLAATFISSQEVARLGVGGGHSRLGTEEGENGV